MQPYTLPVCPPGQLVQVVRHAAELADEVRLLGGEPLPYHAPVHRCLTISLAETPAFLAFDFRA